MVVSDHVVAIVAVLLAAVVASDAAEVGFIGEGGVCGSQSQKSQEGVMFEHDY